MSFVDPPGSGDAAGDVSWPLPTWRDLPHEPPYDSVAPPRTANIRGVFASAVIQGEPTIRPAQIALAVGGTLLLVAIGIGAALFLLRDDDDVVTRDPVPAPPVQLDPPDDGPAPQPLPAPAPNGPQLTPTPLPPTDPPSNEQDDADVATGDADQQPPDTGSQPPETGPDEDAAVEPDDQGPGEDQPSPTPQGPEPDPSAAPSPPEQFGDEPPPPEPDPSNSIDDQEDVDLPRLFTLRTLPTGVAEEFTTMRQTSRSEEIVAEEQTTLLQADAGDDVTVHATRSADAADLLDTFLTPAAEEISLGDLTGYVLPESDQERRLVYLIPGPTDTLIQVTAPQGLDIDQVLIIAQGLVLLR